MRRFLVSCILLTTVAATALGQKITNIRAAVEGEKIVVTYSLDQQAKVSRMYIVVDGKKTEIPYSCLSGDIYRNVTPGNGKRVVYDVLKHMEKGLDSDNVKFVLRAEPVYTAEKPAYPVSSGTSAGSKKSGHGSKNKRYGNNIYSNANSVLGLKDGPGEVGLYVLADFGVGFSSEFSGGITAGVSFGRMGLYGKVRFTADYDMQADYVCDKNGGIVTDNGGYVVPFYGKETKNPFLLVNVGVTVKLVGPLYAYVGCGYGETRTMWMTQNEKWVENSHYTCKGFSSEVGLMLSFSRFTFSVGVNNINFKYGEADFGVGFNL